MNKYIKGFSIIILMIFSFYYTEKIALYVQNNTPLKKEIVLYSKDNNIKSVNAIIDGKYITPGINGLLVNIDKSYNQMKIYNVFSEKYIVYDEVKPEISTKEFKDKIINKGNSLRNSVSLIISKNNQSIDYLVTKNIKFDYVNDTNYCIKLNDNNCTNSIKPIVEPTVIFDNNSFLRKIDNIGKGYLIYIDDNLNQDYLIYLINRINYLNLKIMKLSNHLSENYQL